MLPPVLATAVLVDPLQGSDAALAARVGGGTAPDARVLVLGAGRPGLLSAIAAEGRRVVGIDTSRTVLRRARGALGEATPGIELLISDPRELDVPGAVDAVLVPSLPWRAVVLPRDRIMILSEFASALAGDGRLFLDLEELAPGAAPLPARGVRWDWIDGDLVATCEDAGSASGHDARVTLATFDMANAVDELRAAGFSTIDATRVAGGRDGGRHWIAAGVSA